MTTLPARTITLFLFVTMYIAIVARFAYLTAAPRGLNWDETAYAYNALSLMQTGKDEWGAHMPLFLQSFGEYKPALLSYLLIPGMALFPKSDVPIRVVPAILGAISVYVFYALVERLTKNKLHALLAAACLAVAPWHIHFSRVALDPGLGSALLIFGLFGWTGPHLKHRLTGALLLLASLWAYNANRVVVPPLLVLYGLFFWRGHYRAQLQKYALPLVVLTVGSALVLYATFFGVAGYRARQISTLFSTQTPAQKIAAITRQYSLFWHPNFLFFSDHYERNPILGYPDYGHLPMLFLPFAIIGITQLFKQRTRVDGFFAAWLLLGPIPAALTWGDPHAGRAIHMLPPLLYFTALGWEQFMLPFTKVIHVKLLIPYALLIIMASFTVFFTDYLKFYPAQSERKWQGQYQAMSKWVYQRSADQTVWIAGEPEQHALLFYAWYNRIDPRLIQQAHRVYGSAVFIDRFGKTNLLYSPSGNWKCDVFNSTGLVVLNGTQSLELSSLPIQEFFYYNPSAQPQRAFAVYQVSQLTETDLRALEASCNQL